MQADFERRVEPLAQGWRHVGWGTGMFDTGRRSFTPEVEGAIRTPQHLIMVTLRGDAQSVEVQSDCGHRYVGPDRAGAVSFVPAFCRRRLQMRGVASEWASVSLSPALFAAEGAGGTLDDAAFTNADDAFIQGLVMEFARLLARVARSTPPIAIRCRGRWRAIWLPATAGPSCDARSNAPCRAGGCDASRTISKRISPNRCASVRWRSWSASHPAFTARSAPPPAVRRWTSSTNNGSNVPRRISTRATIPWRRSR
jgi:hypothetical protein